MSFILDALRKSESERQRKQQPGMVSGQVQKPRRGSGFWIPLVMLLVGINISLIFVMWVMGDRAGPSEAKTTISPAPAPTVSAPAASISAAPTVPASTSTPARSQPTAPAPATQRDIYSANANEEYADLPSIEELLLSNQITITPLRLDIHVYSDNPEERFVFINMNKYTEGAMLEEGPKLVAITDTGVVLLHQGQEFLMSRE
ncbi:MAG: general secretion pathway protein GspB [Gammaproteobacteria bacterium]